MLRDDVRSKSSLYYPSCHLQGDVFLCYAWSAKHSKMAQPDLDFIAPEVQLAPTSQAAGVASECSFAVDMFSLGQTICAIYNDGRSLLQCHHNPANYSKLTEQVCSTFCFRSPKKQETNDCETLTNVW